MSSTINSKNQELVEEEENDNYVAAAKKPISEYVKLDAEDESLARWKRSLGLTNSGVNSIGEEGDERRVVVLKMEVFIAGREPFTVNVDDPVSLKNFQENPISVPGGVKYHLRVTFRIQHEIVTGLKYVQVAKRGGITLNRISELLGSYPPNTTEKPTYSHDLAENQAPSGFLLRGTYTCTSSFIDDDNKTHYEVPWSINVTK